MIILLTAIDENEQRALEHLYPTHSRTQGVLIEVRGSGPVRAQATAPSLAEFNRATAIKDSITPGIVAEFPWTAVGIGGVPGQFVLNLTTQDPSELPKLREKFPEGTRIQGILVEIEGTDPIKSLGDSTGPESVIGRCADGLSGVIKRLKNLIKH